MSTLIMKFGGTSVGMTTGLTQVLSIVLYERERWDRLLVVVSALEGVTDALLEAAHLAQLSNRRGYRRIVATLRYRHLSLIELLPLGTNERNALQADIDRLLFDMLDLCQSLAERTGETVQPQAIDAIIGVGERLAARIVAALLRQNKLRGVAIDATDIVITNNLFGNATPDLELTRERINRHLMPMLERNIVPVITGFIGATASGTPTTLGRGGSDYTASVIAVCTDADEVWIWTDVDGMMTADPRDIEDAAVIASLSYEETAELAYFGARILHARMIAPLQQRRIPLRVRNVFKPQGSGTLVSAAQDSTPRLKAVTAIQGLGLSAPRSGAIYQVAALVDETLLAITGAHADVMIASQSSSATFLCFVIPTSAGPDALHSLEFALDQQFEARPELRAWGWSSRPVSVVTAIGAHIDQMHTMIAQVFQQLDGVRPLAIAYSPIHCGLSFVVEPDAMEQVESAIHALIVPRV